ncbi:hypothetical protein PMAYCL1PPCAC_19142, partial [Pristionchus mayeri]
FLAYKTVPSPSSFSSHFPLTMIMRLCLLLSAAFLHMGEVATPKEMISVAMEQAIRNVNLMNVVARETIGEDSHPHMQRASFEAREAQKIGDILQETTRILVEENGAGILTTMKGVDALAELESHLKPEHSRKKRQLVRQYSLVTPTTAVGGSNTTNSTNQGTITSSDPLDESCIERPPTCDANFPYRSISGWCNHDDTDDRELGSTMSEIRRFMGETKYDDGFNSVRRRAARGRLLPSTRDISNKIFTEASLPAFDTKYNHFLQ